MTVNKSLHLHGRTFNLTPYTNADYPTTVSSLESLAGSTRTFGGISFLMPQGRTVIVNRQIPHTEIALHQRAEGLACLHTTLAASRGWFHQYSHPYIGRYVVVYGDGAEQVIPVVCGANIGFALNPSSVTGSNFKEFHPQCRMPFCRRVFPGNLYVMVWRNPYPKREIASIRIEYRDAPSTIYHTRPEEYEEIPWVLAALTIIDSNGEQSIGGWPFPWQVLSAEAARHLPHLSNLEDSAMKGYYGSLAREMEAFDKMTDLEFFERLNLDHPGLERIKQAVESCDVEAAWKAWADYHRTGQRPKWIYDPESYRHFIDKYMPHLRPLIIRWADAICHGDFKGSSSTLSPDWYQEIAQDLTVQWVKLPPGPDYFFWIDTLAPAYALTGDEKYVRAWVKFVGDWCEQLPSFMSEYSVDWVQQWKNRYYPRYVGYLFQLGTSIRLRNMLAGYFVMRKSPLLDADFHRKFMRTVYTDCMFMAMENRAMGRYRNDVFSVAANLVTGVIMLPEFKESARWLRESIRDTENHLCLSFHSDGLQREYSSNYFLTCLRDVTYASLVMERNLGWSFYTREPTRSAIEAALNFLLQSSSPTGVQLGMSAGGYYDEWLTYLIIGLQFFDNSDFAYIAQARHRPGYFTAHGHYIMDISLLNEDSASKFFTCRLPEATQPPTDSLFADSGFATMRDSWDEDALYFSFDFTRLPWGPHAFFSKLCFYAWAYGQPLALNPGYGHGSGLGPTNLHNTVTVDNQSQEYTDAHLLYWFDSPVATFVAASCDGYQSQRGVQQQREILFIKGFGWVLSDVQYPIWDGESHTYQWHLHTPLPLTWNASGRAVSTDAPGFIVMEAYPHEIRARQAENDCAIPYTFQDALLGDPKAPKFWSGVQKVSWLTLEKSASNQKVADPTTFLIAIAPHREKTPELKWQPLPVTKMGQTLHRGSAEAAEMMHPSGRDIAIFNHQRCGEIACGDIVTDGRAGLVRRQGGEVSAFAVVDATGLKLVGQTILEAQSPISLSVQYEERGVTGHARTEEKTSFRLHTPCTVEHATLNRHTFPPLVLGGLVEMELPGPGSWSIHLRSKT